MKRQFLQVLSVAVLYMFNFHAVAAPSSTNAVAAPSSTNAMAKPVSTNAIVEADQNDEATTLEISDGWARKSTSENSNSAVYMKISNPSEQQIAILGASCFAVANKVELHKSFVDEKGISRMTMVDKIVVPADSEIELAPGGTHIMLFELKKNLSAGDTFEITLQLDGMDSITAEVVVK